MRLGQIDFFLLGINFCDFEKVPSTQYPALIDIFKQYYGMYTLCKISICSLIYLFVSEWKRQVVIEQTWFLYFWLANLSQRILKETGCNWTDMISVFLVSEFKSEDIYSRVNYCGKNVCGNFPLWELIFADHWKNCKKATILCHTTADWCIYDLLFVCLKYICTTA